MEADIVGLYIANTTFHTIESDATWKDTPPPFFDVQCLSQWETHEEIYTVQIFHAKSIIKSVMATEITPWMVTSDVPAADALEIDASS